MNNVPVGKNWVIEMKTGGGGGYGNPLEREPERVLKDYLNGFISRERAKDAYGVIITDDRQIDLAATARLRQAQAEERR